MKSHSKKPFVSRKKRWFLTSPPSQSAVQSNIIRAVDILKTAFALGADHSLLVSTDKETDKDIQPIHVAKVLAKLVKDRKFDLVLLGKQSIDDDYNQTGQMLSALLGWPQVTFISKMDWLPDEKSFIFDREIDGGIQKLKSPPNTVVTCDLRLNKPRQAKLTDIMKSKNKQVETLKLEDFGVDGVHALKVLRVEEPAKRGACVMVKDVDELIHKLRNEAKVI